MIFFDYPEIAEKYGLVTCIDGEPVGLLLGICETGRNMTG